VWKAGSWKEGRCVGCSAVVTHTRLWTIWLGDSRSPHGPTLCPGRLSVDVVPEVQGTGDRASHTTGSRAGGSCCARMYYRRLDHLTTLMFHRQQLGRHCRLVSEAEGLEMLNYSQGHVVNGCMR